VEEAPEHIVQWNEAAQTELEKIQTALNELAKSLRVDEAPEKVLLHPAMTGAALEKPLPQGYL